MTMPQTEDEVMAREEAMAAMDDEQLKAFMTAEESPAEPENAPASEPEAGAPAEPDDEPSDPPADAPAEPAAAPTAEPPAEPDEDEEPAAADLQRSTPADAADQRKTLRAEKSSAMRQLVDGEITQEAFDEIDNRVQDKLDDLSRAEAIDEARQQIRMDMMRGDYDKELRTAQKELAAAGLDLKAKNGAMAAEFDRAVRMFAGEAGARGLSDRPGDLAASREALAEAKALLLRRHGKAAASPAPVAAAPAAPKRDMSPPDRSKLPPTLANAPAARADIPQENRFAHIDSITDTIQREAAIAALSDADQERYMQA